MMLHGTNNLSSIVVVHCIAAIMKFPHLRSIKSKVCFNTFERRYTYETAETQASKGKLAA